MPECCYSTFPGMDVSGVRLSFMSVHGYSDVTAPFSSFACVFAVETGVLESYFQRCRTFCGALSVNVYCYEETPWP